MNSESLYASAGPATVAPLAVASLGLVSPEAATDGVTPIFSWKKLATFFSHYRLSAVSSTVSPLFILS